MRLRRPALLLLLPVLGLSLGPGGALAQPAATSRPPLPVYTGQPPRVVESRSRIEEPRSRLVLEPALQGDLVRHHFLVANDGPEPLGIERVEACAGCILETFTRTVPPGIEGRVTIAIPTDPYGGQEVAGTLRIETADPERPEIRVDVSLLVREFASISPYRVWLRGAPGDEIVETCEVVPNAAYPFNITGIRPRSGAWFSHELREATRGGRRAWLITVRNTRTKPGPYRDVLFVQTDHPERPEFKIRIEGRISDTGPVAPSPPR